MIAIIDYGVGNLFSVEKAFLSLGVDAKITSDKNDINSAEKIVLPGVGAFGDCMKNFWKSGLANVMIDRVKNGIPLLGICVGLQILFEDSEESPDVRGLGLIKGHIKKIPASGLKIPQMGWNSLKFHEPRAQIFENVPDDSYVYFVHSYHAVPDDPRVITASVEYGGTVTAAVQSENIIATQFHPEKSGDVGLIILRNFAL